MPIKKIEDLTVKELNEYCINTSCKKCAFNKGDYECYNLQNLFNDMEYEINIEVQDNE